MKNLLAIGCLNRELFQFQEHQHPFWEIVYYTKGIGSITANRRDIPFLPGHIVCLPPGTPHAERAKNGYRNIYFWVDSFNHPGDGIAVFKDNENKQILDILNQLYNEYHIQRANWRNLTESLMNTAYQYMVSYSAETSKNPYVMKMEECLISNMLNHHLNIRELFSAIPLSLDHARRLFVKDNAVTPSRYLMEKRVQYAKMLLETHSKDKKMNIGEISYIAGFDDPYYFSRVFKSIAGKSPLQWMRSAL